MSDNQGWGDVAYIGNGVGPTQVFKKYRYVTNHGKKFDEKSRTYGVS